MNTQDCTNNSIGLLVGEFALEIGQSLTKYLENRKFAREAGEKEAPFSSLNDTHLQIANNFIHKCSEQNLDIKEFIDLSESVGIHPQIIKHMRGQK